MEIPEFNEIKKQISDLRNELISIITSVNPDSMKQEYYNDEQCWKLKGGMALNTYRNNRFYQCKGGIPDAKVGGRKVWTKKSVLEWLPLNDDELKAYHEKYKTGAKKQ